MPNTREMQKRLSQWATDHPGEQYRDLWNLICSPAWLMEAYDRIKSNSGVDTPGVDGETLTTWEKNRSMRIERLRQQLQSGSYRPQPCRRVYISKRNGKRRPLGIPALRDRIVQEAIRMAIEPVFEADFLDYSYGFRPTRSTHDAAVSIRRWLMASKRMFYVIEGDIKAYFDTIHHRKLMTLLKRRIKDKRVLQAIWCFLKAGVMEEGQLNDTEQGTPQGGVISPLLANIYLHELDRYFHERFLGASHNEKTNRRRRGGYNIGYVRYADDFVVFCNGRMKDVVQLKGDIATYLGQELYLTLSEEKTLISHVEKGFDFLGFQFYRGKDRFGKMKPKVRIPHGRVKSVKEKIKQVTSDKYIFLDEAAIVLNLNRILRGWGNYYRHVPASQTFSNVDRYAFWRLVRWYRRKRHWSTSRVLAHRQSRSKGDKRILAQWQTQGIVKHVRLVNLTRDVRFQERNGRKIPNPFLAEMIDSDRESKRKAGCAETCTSGLGGGLEKPAAVRQ